MNLLSSYPKSKHNVFEGLNLQLNENRIYGLLGKNGMGKSIAAISYMGLPETEEGVVLSLMVTPLHAVIQKC